MRYLIAALALAGALTPAFARWQPQYRNTDAATRAWFSAQHNSQGQWCCDQSDGARYDAPYTLNSDGSVTLADGHTIARELVLTGPNPTGHAVWWRLGDKDFCFALGPLG